MNQTEYMNNSIILVTRLEAIKLAIIIHMLRGDLIMSCHILVTEQHQEMLGQVLCVIGIASDVDLNLMIVISLHLSDLKAGAVDRYLEAETPNF